MALELPVVSAVVARLPQPEINLAAYGGVVFPLALIVESPVIMLLGASTALSVDWGSFVRLRGYMMRGGMALTAVHLLIAFTPLYDFVAIDVLGVPMEIVEPARVGLRIMTPWTWAIAYRRFHQGVLIRFGQSRAVGVGTLVRLSADLAVLALSYFIGETSGVVAGTSAVAAGVVCEAIYTGLRVRPVMRGPLRAAPSIAVPLDFNAFLHFYLPLAMTSLLTLLIQPLGAAALSRMPNALESLAVWPVVSGLVFMLRSLGMAYNEVVIALLDEPQAVWRLRLFTGWLTGLTSFALLILAVTPLASVWFGRVSALSPPLASLAEKALWFALPLPGLNVLQSWYQGVILHDRRTRGVTEAVALFLLTSAVVLLIGVLSKRFPGLYVVWVAFSVGGLVQIAWLRWRSQRAFHSLAARPADVGLL